MNILSEHIQPKILFIQNVFIRDCVILDDLLEKNLMDAANETLEITEINNMYIKLPIVFTSFSTWVKTTNIQCCYCDRTFSDPPVFIPKSAEPTSTGYIMGTEKCFCSFNCAVKYINISYPKIHENINKKGMLNLLFKEFYGINPNEIIPAPDKEIMIQYGGDITAREYHLEIRKLQKISGVQFKKNNTVSRLMYEYDIDDTENINYMGDLF